MIKLKEILMSESVYDKGLFKAIFFAGIPGSGKSYTLNKISDGNIQPRIVNTDKFIEFLTKTTSINVNAAENYPFFKEKVSLLTKNQLSLYINSLLPLFVDGTSNKMSSLFRRDGILKSFGYDTGMVWINTDINVAIKRAEQRDRKVPKDFIENVYKNLNEQIPYYKSNFKFFVEIKNSDGELTDDVILSAYKSVSSFFTSEVENPIGKRNIQIAEKTSGYLTPNIYKSISDIRANLSGWYDSF